MAPEDIYIERAIWTWARETPNAVAITDRGRHITYRELAERADELAGRLRRADVGSEVLVGLSAERSAELVVGIVAILRAGGAYVPIDPTWPAERRTFLLDDARCSIVVTEARLGGMFASSARSLLLLDDPAVDRICEAPCLAADVADPLAYVIYTSGSTGLPKGVLVTRRNAARLFRATARWYRFNHEDVWTLFHSVAFDFSVWEIWGALAHGGRLVIVPHEVTRDPIAFRALIRDEGVTVLCQTPTAFRCFMRADALERTPRRDALRYVIFGGEALDLRSLRPWFDRHGDTAPRLFNMYGITETTVHVTCRPLSACDADEPRSLIGEPLSDLALHVLDPEGTPVSPGQEGEIWVGGAGVARGYLGRPELTRERFVRDPFSHDPNARLYRTGDRARAGTDGELEYTGRVDQQVKIRGFRVELGEIEAALRDAPGVSDAAVIPRTESDGETALVAHLVPREPGELELGAVRQRIAAKLPEHMWPAAMVVIDALPLTENGKLDRDALAAAARLVPSREASTDASALPTEAGTAGAIAALYCAILGAEAVGDGDDFFALGGTSLQAMQLALHVAERLGVILPPGAVFRSPVVRELAAEVDRARANRPATPRREETDEERWYPLSFAQEQMAIVQSIAPESAMFHSPLAFRLRGGIDGEQLARALDAVVRRHPILRTVFRNVEGRFEQRAVAAPTFRLEQRDVSPAGGTTAEHPLVHEAVSTPFALDRGAGRALLLRTGPDEHLLLLVLHHLITDGWSSARLLAELGAAYADRPLPVLRRSFFADAIEQRGRISDGSAAEAERAWLANLAGAPAVTEIPPERARPPRLSFRGALLPFRLDRARMTRLSELAREVGATENMVLLAGLFALVARLAETRDLVLAVPHAGRDVPGTEDVQGPYLNLLPLRAEVAPGVTFRALVATMRDQSAAAFTRGHVPFSRLVQKLGVPRDPARHPVVQVAFAPQPGSRSALSLDGVEAEPVLVDPGKSVYDLTVYTWPAEDGLDVCFEYATDLFSEDGAMRVRDAWIALLEYGAAHPDAPIENASLVTPEQRRRILEEHSGLAGYQRALERPFVSIVERFERCAAEVPGPRRSTVAGAPSRTASSTHGRAAWRRSCTREALPRRRGSRWPPIAHPS